MTGLAHQASRVVQLRGLDTGAARDVSGVLRVSKGGGGPVPGPWDEAGVEGDDEGEGEWLYQIKGDGSVRVWGRGE